MSTPTTRPALPTRSASCRVDCPAPQPMSISLSPGRSQGVDAAHPQGGKLQVEQLAHLDPRLSCKRGRSGWN